jgi:uncharacterized DUF497 family protein
MRKTSPLAGFLSSRRQRLQWDSALIIEDSRRDYGERRFQALGLIEARLHMLVFTPRGSQVHVVSLRKANKREVKRYEAQA